MSIAIAQNKGVSLTVAANDELAVFSMSPFKVYQISAASPNIPAVKTLLYSGAGAYLSSAFTNATSVTIQMGDRNGYYATGTAPTIPEASATEATFSAAGALNATGTLTSALMRGGIVTSTTAAAVTATLDTGTAMSAATDSSALGDAFFWSAINTGGSNAFTVTASTNHTLVGNGAVAANASGRFMTTCSGAGTWVTYRIGS